MRGVVFERISREATRFGPAPAAMADEDLLERKCRDAAQNPRGREIHRFHTEDEDSLQRMINALTPGSYVRPHRHLDPPKAETFVILRGALAVVVFDDEGRCRDEDLILLKRGRGAYLADIRPGTWHTVFALTPEAAAFEVKSGPYLPGAAKGFAPFSPPEGTPEAEIYLMDLEDRFRSAWGLPPRVWGSKA
ncbi:WbuC family cupin fold metalloprotein [Desulfolutivibrio sulfoxidireducens]|uniref:WbuC family cupin fold metalloprotein n=1 Tax=Desulfolutivibrio sulfoxidireducens TaxID=2773299 RepID=UPI00159E1DAE|nr:WbuC family cupin fold metalloprotein [Desulfolutivibrio sulfoxidireducens]QLA15192.1 cupin fold metalloprotein, WbuC family [Desulfolutivibrio sulfoxidireducens]QLA18763.1 cupin fold metalloprotein, WbuC family [Desulfolutivibrio sulfoxidireducens]